MQVAGETTRRHSRAAKRWGDVAAYALLTLFSLGILLPILWTLRTSLAPEVIVYRIPPPPYFKPTLANYLELLEVNEFGRYLRNSLVVAIGTTAISVPIAAMGGWAFARFNTGGRTMQFVILSTQMLPGIVLILPLFVLFTKLHLKDTLHGLVWAYLAFNLPFLVWLLMGFFQGIPRELEEAAMIDGTSYVGAFFRVIFPTAAPGVMSAAVLSFVMAWNEFLFALILTGSGTNTIPVMLAAMQTHRGVLIGRLAAATMIAVAPMILLSLSVQRYLVRGLTFGAIK
ncbi:MAG: carbohydrate ABC transporter permease [Limnochordaceae bacterium]|nr:carbohydrate ABC transporter permease [Limnochordaceae bacterium]